LDFDHRLGDEGDARSLKDETHPDRKVADNRDRHGEESIPFRTSLAIDD
jgi:hypothetical protein